MQSMDFSKQQSLSDNVYYQLYNDTIRWHTPPNAVCWRCFIFGNCRAETLCSVVTLQPVNTYTGKTLNHFYHLVLAVYRSDRYDLRVTYLMAPPDIWNWVDKAKWSKEGSRKTAAHRLTVGAKVSQRQGSGKSCSPGTKTPPTERFCAFCEEKMCWRHARKNEYFLKYCRQSKSKRSFPTLRHV